jgi:hypothetical protein
MPSLPYILNEQSVTVYVEGTEPKTIHADNSYFKAIVNAIKDEDWVEVVELIDVAKSILKFGEGNLSVVDGEVLYKGNSVANVMTGRILRMISEGFNVKPMLRFLDNLLSNPAYHAQQELYDFLAVNSIPITEDGCFLAYKKVGAGYKDIWSGKFDNSVGATPTMDRGAVDDKRDRTCSSGLHFCSFSYLKSFGSGPGNHVMIVKINPRDVVSIPVDYNNAKGRCCDYEVVQEHFGYYDDNEDEYFKDLVYASDGLAFDHTSSGDEDNQCNNTNNDYDDGYADGYTAGSR